jgi:hypothetical protein
MATTTPNYGWTVPTSTDLVKDGATAIETLGDSVDATVKALNPETTLGDISYRSSTANTNTRLGIGSTGQVLTVSGGVPAWATASSGGMTSIASGSLSGASVNLTSISQSYKDLRLVIRGPQQSSDEDFYIRPNSDSTGPYAVIGGTSLSATMVVSTNRSNVSATDVLGNSLMESSVTDNLVIYDFPDYATTSTNHIIQMRNAYTNDSAVNVAGFSTTNYCPATPVAITSILIVSDAGSWTGGTYILYGVS